MTLTPLRLRIASCAAVGAALLSVIQVLITPAHLDGSTSELVHAAAAHTGAAYAAGWAEMLWGLLAGLACVTLIGIIRPGRGHRLAVAGGWLNTVSLLALGFSTLAISQAAIAAGTDASTATKAIDAMNKSIALSPLLVLLVGGLLFPILLGVGLARSGLVGWWYVGLTVLASVFFIGLGGTAAVALRLLAVLPTAATWLVWATLMNRHSAIAGSDAAFVRTSAAPA
jgi:hypothetical protein